MPAAFSREFWKDTSEPLPSSSISVTLREKCTCLPTFQTEVPIQILSLSLFFVFI